jgi:hypothetical protein
MARNYALEGRIREYCAAQGVREEALDEFCLDHESYKFTEQELPQYVERMRTEKPQRFTVQNGEQERAAIEAFGPNGTITAQGAYLRRYGQAEAERAAAMFGVTVGSTKKGTVPEHLKSQAAAGDHSRGTDNPWSGIDGRGLPTTDKFGRFLPSQVSKQLAFVKMLVAAHGEKAALERANAVARAVGCVVGSTRPAKKVA